MPIRKCERCGGRMFLDEFHESCKRCKDTGAQRCDLCWVHREWSCLACGRTAHEPRVRRRDLNG